MKEEETPPSSSAALGLQGAKKAFPELDITGEIGRSKQIV